MFFSEILISANKKIVIIVRLIFYHILFMTHLAIDRQVYRKLVNKENHIY